MAIERGIYGSLCRGIDSDRTGFQFYSYTPGYHSALGDSQQLINSLIASYRSPNTYEYYKRFKETEHTDADRATASEEAEAEHPQSFSYRAVQLGDETKGVFCYAQDMGMDWTGNRPQTPYHYSVVCAQSDLLQPPVFYCSSPSVCCNIFWGGFFDPHIAEMQPAPLTYIRSLEDDDPALQVPHEAAFPKITQEDIRSFLTHEQRLPVFCRLLKAVMCCKEHKDERRVVIADHKENILYWIAAVSCVFPLAATLDLSFNTYGFQIGDYDVNGVFVPELEGIQMESDRSATQYDPREAVKKHWVFDFSQNSFASELPMKQSAFMQMVQRTFTNNTTELEDYKRFIMEHTACRSIDSSYEAGYALYAALYQNSTESELLEEATGFAAEFAKEEDKGRLLNIIYTYWTQRPDNTDAIRVFRQFYQNCESQGVSGTEVTLNKCIANWYQSFAEDDKTDLDAFAAMGSGLENLLGYTETQLAVRFVEFAGLEVLSRVSETISVQWKQMYLHRAIAFYVSSGSGTIRGELESRILYQTARGMASASTSFPAVIEKTIDGMFKVIQSLELRMQYLFIISQAMRDADMQKAVAVTRQKLSKLYLDADDSTRSQILNAMRTDGKDDEFLPEILSAICGKTDPKELTDEFQMILRICGNRFAPEMKHSVLLALSGQMNQSTTILDRVSEFLGACEHNPDAALSESESRQLWDMYYKAFCAENPGFKTSQNAVSALYRVMQRFKQYVSKEQYNMILAYDTIWRRERKLRQGGAIVFEKPESGNGVDLSLLPPADYTSYLSAVGELCAQYWLISKHTVPAGINSFYMTPKSADSTKAENAVLKSAFSCLGREKRSERRNWVLIKIPEYLMEQNQTVFMETLISKLPACDIREKDILQQLSREEKSLYSNQAGSGLTIQELAELRRMIQTVYMGDNTGGRLGDLKSTLKGLFRH